MSVKGLQNEPLPKQLLLHLLANGKVFASQSTVLKPVYISLKQCSYAPRSHKTWQDTINGATAQANLETNSYQRPQVPSLYPEKSDA